MPTIGIWVDEETKRKWDILNKHPDRIGTKELRKAVERIIEEYEWWFRVYEQIQDLISLKKEAEIEEQIQGITQQEILSEI